MIIFNMPDGWQPPSKRIQNLAAKVINEIIVNMRREIDAEIMATHHFYCNNIHFKMYLN